jgi:cytoskeletal protein CcmA (bactofilin family)
MASAKEFSSSADSNTVIGPTILINGKLTGDEDLTVRGRVEGELSLTKTLIVEPSGIIKADVEVKNAIVSGVVVGNIHATESVELTKEGRMVGDIRAPRVIIVDGASFRGRVDMGQAEGRAAAERPARPVVRAGARNVAAPPRPPSAPSRSDSDGRAGVRTRSEGKPSPPGLPTVASVPKKKILVKKKAR